MIGFVTDRRRAPDRSPAFLIERVRAAVAAGVDWIQVRERDLCDRDLVGLVRVVVEIVGGTRTRVLVNDRVDIALAAGADGVHLRGDSAHPARIRALVPPGFLIGRSIHSAGEASIARDCDFLLFGTVFPSAGKAAGHAVAGSSGLRAACAQSLVPVLAIGGIDERNARDAAAAGAAGIAAVGMFMRERSLVELAGALNAVRAAFVS